VEESGASLADLTHTRPGSAKRAIRLPWIDAARGIAIVAMVIYHFSWDLGFFGFIATDVASAPGWVIFARLIAGSFLALVGVSLVLATRQGLNWRRFLIRLAMIIAGAAAVTLVTWFAIPQAFVFFGILHLIAAASVLGLIFVRLPALVLGVLAAAWFAVWWFFEHSIFDHPALLWVGLGTVPPQTNDYTPIFPWFGVVLAGMALAKLLIWSRRATDMLARPAPRPLTWAGRHSLAIYLIHQPVLFGLTWLAALAIPPDIETFRARHLQNCTVQCVAMNADEAFCRDACVCVGAKVEAESDGMWEDLVRGRISEEQNERYRAFAEQCVAEMAEE